MSDVLYIGAYIAPKPSRKSVAWQSRQSRCGSRTKMSSRMCELHSFYSVPAWSAENEDHFVEQ